MRSPTHLRTTLALTALVALTTPSLAQESTGADPPDPSQTPSSGIDWAVSTAFEYDFNTDFDSGGDVEIFSADIGLAARTRLSDQVGLRLFSSYSYEDWEFGGNKGFGALDPWDNVNLFNITATISVTTEGGLSFFGGPILQFAWESGADLDDSFQGGGILGTAYRFSDTLELGIGVVALSQIEDDVRFFPAFVIDWQITDDLRLVSRRETGVGPFAGTELIWSCAENWELGIGIDYREQRFRLDDDAGVAKDGVGRRRSLPVWLRAGWTPSPSVRVDAFLGVLLEGELRLENSKGNLIAEDDIDPMPAIGLAGQISF